MLAFENMVTNKTGVFPNAAAKNASGSGATDGTEYLAAILNDEWGFWQEILQRAGQTPNGVTETAASNGVVALGTAQQKYSALQMLGLGAPGTLCLDMIVPGTGTYGAGAQSMAWGASTGGPPTRYQYRRVLRLQGQTVLIASFPDLVAAIYCGDANNAAAICCYKASDSAGVTRSTSGAYMVLPDARGCVPIGTDTAAVHSPWSTVLYPHIGLSTDQHAVASGRVITYFVCNVGIWY